ncbi:unnamed protein product, partial [Ectocarpus sp. 12 AP-2014]
MVFERFTERAIQAVMRSQEEARLIGHNFVGTEQILLGLMREKEGITCRNIMKFNVSLNDLRLEVERIIGRGKGFISLEIPFTPRAKRLLEMSVIQSKQLNRSYVAPEHLLLAILNDQSSICINILQNLDVDIAKLKKNVLFELGEITDGYNSNYENNEKNSEDDDYKPKDLFLYNDFDEEVFNNPNLQEFTSDLTADAKAGKLDPMIGRENEIERVIQILGRRRKNNPILIGPAGVGKTAVAEGLAQQIIDKKVPRQLHNYKIIVLDITLLLAGTKYRGEFEERLKLILDEMKSFPNIIIVIDEVHTLVGAGSAEGALDAANILKPALARGELQCIGATTVDEFRQYIQKDPALERRFQPVWVNEPSIEETIAILKGLRMSYEHHHQVKIEDEAIEAAVKLGSQYINDRFLPDKAIDLIDEGSSRVRHINCNLPLAVQTLEGELSNIISKKDKSVREQNYEKAEIYKKQEKTTRGHMASIIRVQAEDRAEAGMPDGVLDTLKVDADDIAAIVAVWTGVPVTNITEDENSRLIDLENLLHTRIIGQKEAVSAIARAVRRARLGMRDMNRPIASFFFSGPTGVGKTELTKTLASFFFGAEDAMVRLDMSEYMERHTVAKLIGSPPGYVGYSEGGILTEAVRRKPYTLILFDEVEKAHADIYNLLLQILDDGRLTDSQGHTVDFTNTIIIMTSNLGSTEIDEQEEDENLEKNEEKKLTPYEQLREIVIKSLKKYFRPEFLNRLDEIIVFEQLTKEHITKIADIMVKDLIKRVHEEKNITLNLSEKMMNLLVEEGFDPQYGARPLRRAIVKLIEDNVSLAFLRYMKEKEMKKNPVTVSLDVDSKNQVKVHIIE